MLSEWTKEYIIMRYLQQKAAEMMIAEKLAFNGVIDERYMGFYNAMACTYLLISDGNNKLTSNSKKSRSYL